MDDSEAREQNPNESAAQCSNESMNRSMEHSQGNDNQWMARKQGSRIPMNPRFNASVEQWRNPSITQLVESMNLRLNEPRKMLHRINNLGDQWINEAESMGQLAWIRAFMNPISSAAADLNSKMWNHMGVVIV